MVAATAFVEGSDVDAAGPLGLFGTGAVVVTSSTAPVPGSNNLNAARSRLAALEADDRPALHLSRCRPTAAFSRRDTLLPGYLEAVEVAHEHGFEPVVRPVGGRLAAYDEGCLVVHCAAAHPDPRSHIAQRFGAFARAVSMALESLGLADVRVGPVPGEYCSGSWSVNVGGQHKLAGTGQRITRHGYLFSAVITVSDPVSTQALLTEAYAALDLEFDPASIGCVDRWVAGVTTADVATEVQRQLVDLIDEQVHATEDLWPAPAEDAPAR